MNRFISCFWACFPIALRQPAPFKCLLIVEVPCRVPVLSQIVCGCSRICAHRLHIIFGAPSVPLATCSKEFHASDWCFESQRILLFLPQSVCSHHRTKSSLVISVYWTKPFLRSGPTRIRQAGTVRGGRGRRNSGSNESNVCWLPEGSGVNICWSVDRRQVGLSTISLS